MNISPASVSLGGSHPPSRDQTVPGVVEVGLLLPANRVAALLNLARSRDETVGQMVRRLIDRELANQG